MSFKPPRLRHGTVVAYLALFVALGGTSYALTVTTDDVPKNALTGADIKNLTATDFKGGDLPIESVVVVSNPVTVNSGGSGFAQVSCPAGWIQTGGGYDVGAGIAGHVASSLPADTTSWLVQVAGAPPGDTFRAFVNCIN